MAACPSPLHRRHIRGAANHTGLLTRPSAKWPLLATTQRYRCSRFALCASRNHARVVPAGSGSASISSNDIQAVVRLVGYGLNPFTTSQQGTLQVTLYDVLPHISSQVRHPSLCMHHVPCQPSQRMLGEDDPAQIILVQPMFDLAIPAPRLATYQATMT